MPLILQEPNHYTNIINLQNDPDVESLKFYDCQQRYPKFSQVINKSCHHECHDKTKKRDTKENVSGRKSILEDDFSLFHLIFNLQLKNKFNF